MTGRAIGLDLGTSGIRAALVDAAGDSLAFAAIPIPPDARRRPSAWLDAAERAIAALGDAADLSAVAALAVDGTSGTILPVDANGTPLAEASLYNDKADTDSVATIAAVAAEDSAARGGTSPLARLLGWRKLPGLACVLHEADFLAAQFTGRFDTTDANNALKSGFDPREADWPAWVTGLAGPILPRVVAAGSALDTIRPDVADRLGLPRRLLVAAGTTDGCAAFLATGASETGDAVTSLGTTLTLKLLSATPVFAPAYGIYSHLVLGRWLAGGASNSGGAALLRHFTAPDLTRLSAAMDGATDSTLDYYPLPSPGERFPLADPSMLPRDTPRPDDDTDFLRGLLQGIASIESLGYRRLTELGASALSNVRTVGGGARNAAWTAMRARRLGVPMPPPRSEEAAVGTATLALTALTE